MMSDDGNGRTRSRHGLLDRLNATRQWISRSWSEEAVMMYRRSASGKKRFQVVGVEVFLFTREVIRDFIRVGGTSRAASLAYTTLLSLIPLVVAFSMAIRSYFSRIFPDIRSQADTIFNVILPYQAPQIAFHLNRFAENAETASALGVIVFLVISFRLFLAVEASINVIWHVERVRGYRARFRAFTMLLFWGPILIGLSFATSVSLQQNPYLRMLIEQTFLPDFIAVFVLFLAFTMLFWLVPTTRVQITSAMTGAAVTTILFQGLRYGFGYYARHLFEGRLNVIYGTLGLVIIFLLLMEFMWVVILLGVQISYVHQNLRGLLRASELQLVDQPQYDHYFALRTLIEIARSFEAREEAPSSYRLAEQFGATDAQMLRVLKRLEGEKLVKEIGGDWTGWVPGGDPDRITIEEVVAVMEGRYRQVPPSAAAEPDQAVSELFQYLDRCTSDALQTRSVGQMVRDLYGPRRPSREEDAVPAEG